MFTALVPSCGYPVISSTEPLRAATDVLRDHLTLKTDCTVTLIPYSVLIHSAGALTSP